MPVTQEQIDELVAAALALAGGPKSVTVDGNRVDQPAIKDLLDGIDRLQESANVSRRTLPVRLMKIRPGGPVV